MILGSRTISPVRAENPDDVATLQTLVIFLRRWVAARRERLDLGTTDDARRNPPFSADHFPRSSLPIMDFP